MQWTMIVSWVTLNQDILLLTLLGLHLVSVLWIFVDSIRIERSILFTLMITLIAAITPVIGLFIYMLIRYTKLTSHATASRRTHSAMLTR
ncbi:hypothetical protein MH117_25315 [Paenibacillus sp. ACRRX]|uniref:hypothetical protein n=1 Tax=unclassified Paenibacillus TaxID=185978 RepID=UPI001EF6F87B|nr:MULTISPECIES: hypothetical protein [unclassified Paenibacillus]MCG7410719.1 hypothetical protein [Paenibacillus sp. ACRRX]MDK8184018.1 hypothetical protein [Paenibacillus sp. UMB4589-SE434]